MKEIAYFDNAATTFPKPVKVVEKLKEEFIGSYRRSSIQCDVDYVAEARSILLSFLNATEKYEVTIQSSATEAINTAIMGIDIKNESNIYITYFEHNAVLRTLYALKIQKQFNIHFLSMTDDKKEFDLDSIKRQFDENKPDLLIMNHASNAFGLITPINDIIKLCKTKPITIVDGAQTVGLLNIDLSDELIDILIYAGHKTLYGPIGVGGMVKSKKISVKPLIYGGTGIESENEKMPSDISSFEVGTKSTSLIAGFVEALRWIKETTIDKIKENEEENFKRLLLILEKCYDINIFKFYKQIGVVSITHNFLSPDELSKIFSKYNIVCRTGMQCAPKAHHLLETAPAGTVRLSVSYFTSDTDFDKLEQAIEMLDYI